MIKEDMTKLQITFPKHLKKQLDIRVAEERKTWNATKSTILQKAFEEYLRKKEN